MIQVMPCALAAASFSRCFSTYIVLRDKISHRSRVVGGIDRPATVARRVTPFAMDALTRALPWISSLSEPGRSNLDTKDTQTEPVCLNMEIGRAHV